MDSIFLYVLQLYPIIICCLIWNYDYLKNMVLRLIIKLLDKYGLGYASALVDTYFFGYLKIVLPDKGTHCMIGIEERIKHYILDQQLTNEVFPVHKLFLLVTSSGYSPADLSQFRANGRMRLRGCLTEEPEENRNGVKGRVYRTSVYKIYSEDKKKHVSVVLEAAPALRPMYDAAARNPSLKVFLPHIIETFVKQLQIKLDENADCKDKCEIIYCDESTDFVLPDEIIKRVNKYVQIPTNL